MSTQASRRIYCLILTAFLFFAMPDGLRARAQGFNSGGSTPPPVSVNVGSSSGGSGSAGTTTASIAGSGGDINGTADSFHFLFQPVSGNYTLIARVTSMADASKNTGDCAGAKIGLMLREGSGDTTDPSARMEMIYIQPTLDGDANDCTPIQYQIGSVRRIQYGEDAVARLKTINPAAPNYTTDSKFWLRLQRYGDLISLDYSYDQSPQQWISVLSLEALTNLSSTIQIGFAATSRDSTSGATISANFDNVQLTAIPTPVTPVDTSWIGNTYGGGGEFVMYHGESMTTDPDGNVYVVGEAEQEQAEAFDKNGKFICIFDKTHYDTTSAIAYAADYGNGNGPLVFIPGGAFPDSTNSLALGGIRYFQPDGTYLATLYQTVSGGTVTAATNFVGVAVDPAKKVLYAVDAGAKVHVVDLTSTTFNEKSSFNLPSGTANIVVDPSGNIWAVVKGSSPYVAKFNSTGTQSVKISGLTDPRGIAVDSSSNLYVSDYDVTVQQVQVYNSSGGKIVSLGALKGEHATSCAGGATAGTAGQVESCKLNHPEGIAVDASGDLYIANSGPKTSMYNGTGMTLRRYTGIAPSPTSSSALGVSSNQKFQVAGLEYTDSATPDSDDQDTYSKFHHYKMNFNNMTAGTEWTLQGDLIDDVDYGGSSGDTRLTDTNRDGGVWIRNITNSALHLSGFKLLIMNDQEGNKISMYRFQSGAEYTIPFANFIRETDRGQTDDAESLWVDTNLDGLIDGSETTLVGQGTKTSPVASPSSLYYTWFIDANGDVWTTGGGSTPKLYHYPLKSFEVGGVYYPTWDINSPDIYTLPAEFATTDTSSVDLMRIFYNPSADVMYLGGYTNSAKHISTDGPIGLGTQIVRYSGFLAAYNGGKVPTSSCTIALPPIIPDRIINGKTQAGTGDAVAVMDVAGSLLGVETNFTNIVFLYNNSTCAAVTNFSPGPEVAGASGTIDEPQTFNMYLRGSDEYLIFSEEGGEHKVIMYRYIYQ